MTIPERTILFLPLAETAVSSMLSGDVFKNGAFVDPAAWRSDNSPSQIPREHYTLSESTRS